MNRKINNKNDNVNIVIIFCSDLETLIQFAFDKVLDAEDKSVRKDKERVTKIVNEFLDGQR